jgi:hypothetical protein
MCGARVLAAYLARYAGGDAIRTVDGMCNLYSVTTNKVAIRELARAMGEFTDTVGNFEPLPAVFPDRVAHHHQLAAAIKRTTGAPMPASADSDTATNIVFMTSAGGKRAS